MNRRRYARYLALAILASALSPLAARAQVLYQDNFNTDTSANYSVFQTTGTGGVATSDATFAYDYSALGIPAAPHTSDGTTLGLRMRVDNLANSIAPAAVGAIAVATKNLSLTAPYTVTADVWGNYIGSTGSGLASSGSNGTTGASLGIGTSGNSLQSPNANDGFMADAIHDGGTPTYRAYVNNTNEPVSSGFYLAGTAAGSNNATNSYYSFMGPQAAPSLQQTNFSTTQFGSTPAGIIGFAWHTFTITQDGTNVTWYIDGVPIANVPDSAFTGFGGTNISIGAFDTGLTGNTAANNQLLNADIWDNLVVTQGVPEPGSLALLGLAGAGLLIRRKRRKA